MPKRRLIPAYFEVRRNQDGRERYYWNPASAYKREGFHLRRLSDDKLDAFREAAALNDQLLKWRLGVDRPNGPTIGTLAWLITEYRSDPDYAELAPKTRREYEKHLEWLRQKFGDLKPSAITPRVVQKIKRDGGDTPSQTNARLRVISILYNWGMRLHHEAVEANPAERFRRLRTEPRSRVWSPAEEAAFITAARPSMALALRLALGTLQREGDLIALPWSAYDGQSLVVRQAKLARSPEPVTVYAWLFDDLKAALDHWPRRHVTLLYSEATGKPYDEHHFRKAFAQDRAKAGLPADLKFSDTRRTGMVRMKEAGIDTEWIAALSGHQIDRCRRILETYLPRTKAMARAAVEAMAEHRKARNDD